VIPDFAENGNLPPGCYTASWGEIVDRFGFTPHRMTLAGGLRAAAFALQSAGCRRLYVNGSFTTAIRIPGDFDACWDTQGVDPNRLDPVLKSFANGRAAQKAKYFGELFPAGFLANLSGRTYLQFFQLDKHTGEAKGILLLDLRSFS